MIRLRTDLVLLTLAIAAVVVAIAAGLRAIDSPSTARLRQLDARRVEDLQDIQRAIDLRWSREPSLPSSLDALASTGTRPVRRDPATGQPYAYRPVSDRSYDLCAEFSEPSTARDERAVRDFWAHAAGRHCFRLEARERVP